VTSVLPSGPYTGAQVRIIDAALDLFAVHGVSGTSLQMIADTVGVAKASVYYQFKTKDEIVIAAAEADMARLEAVVAAAESEEQGPHTLDRLLTQLVDLGVEHRRIVSLLQNDPVMVRLLSEHEPFRQIMDRLHHLLVALLSGDPRADPTADARVPAAMLSAAIGGAVVHPLLIDLDDETLRSNLLDLARRFLDLPA
jgi:AcrR family transcriptional regulator